MFTLSGFKGDQPALLAGGNFISYTASLAMAIWLSDHVGRRKLMLSGCFLMGLVLIVGAVLSHEVEAEIHLHEAAKSRQYGAGVVTVLYVYTVLYGSTWLTTCWVYPTEVRFPIFPLCNWCCSIRPDRPIGFPPRHTRKRDRPCHCRLLLGRRPDQRDRAVPHFCHQLLRLCALRPLELHHAGADLSVLHRDGKSGFRGHGLALFEQQPIRLASGEAVCRTLRAGRRDRRR